MLPLQSIPSLSSEVVDLLEALGYLDVQELCDAPSESLLEEALKANEALKIVSAPLHLEDVEEWKAVARSAIAECAGSEEKSLGENEPEPVNLDDRAQDGLPSTQEVFSAEPETVVSVEAMLKDAPTAELLPAELIRKNNLRVSDIAEGILLSECPEGMEIKYFSQEKPAKSIPAEKAAISPKGGLQQKGTIPPKKSTPLPKKEDVATSERKRSELMSSKIRDFSQAESDDYHVKPLDRGESREVVSTSKGLNKGLSPDDRRFVRGVLHPDPWRVRTSAFFAVLAQVLLIANFVLVPGAIAYDFFYDVPDMVWGIVGLLIALLLSGIAYLIWGLSARCRVCGQRQFAPKMCLKHRKAHHIPLIGYIFPTALHAMFYKWFYCIYCGTAVRLKK